MKEVISRSITRRTALRWAALGALSLGFPVTSPTSHTHSALDNMLTAEAANEEPTEPPPRFSFDCVSVVPLFAPLTHIEEVWASPRYLTFTGCRVRYIGEDPFVLTTEESAIVDVVAAAGGNTADPTGTYLDVLAASTRIDPARFSAALADLGAPVALGVLAFAPKAPQARMITEWLVSVGALAPTEEREWPPAP